MTGDNRPRGRSGAKLPNDLLDDFYFVRLARGHPCLSLSVRSLPHGKPHLTLAVGNPARFDYKAVPISDVVLNSFVSCHVLFWLAQVAQWMDFAEAFDPQGQSPGRLPRCEPTK